MFDLLALEQAIARHGPVARIVIADFAGSSPREVGASMLVWADGLSGTIGGGALEWEAIARARVLLPKGGAALTRDALGPKLGQCCGGVVTLLTEVYDAAALAPLRGQEVIARSFDGSEMPLAAHKALAQARAQGGPPTAQLYGGWMVEPLARPSRQIWLWGAGHVGRAMVDVLRPLPDMAITWIDTDRARFPDHIPDDVTPIWAEAPALLVDHAPAGAEHLIFTFSHALDFELCHRLLARDTFGFAGLIGSATKWARFRKRLLDLGHSDAKAHKICCPIGHPQLGKHPQAIAIGVAQQLLSLHVTPQMERPDDNRDDRAFTLGRFDESLSRRHRQ